jgi:glycine dehydrogenase
MLKRLGYESLDQLTDAAVPDSIKLKKDLAIGKGISEYEVLLKIKEIAEKNKVSV